MRWEVHLPLTYGDRTMGVARWAASARGRIAATRAALERLAGQAAVALAEAGALAERKWLSKVNAAVLDGVREGIALVGLDHELVFANTSMERLARSLAMPVGARDRRRGEEVDPFVAWEVMLAEADEPTADELTIAGRVLERYTAPVDDEAGARLAGSWSCATSRASARSSS